MGPGGVGGELPASRARQRQPPISAAVTGPCPPMGGPKRGKGGAQGGAFLSVTGRKSPPSPAVIGCPVSCECLSRSLQPGAAGRCPGLGFLRRDPRSRSSPLAQVWG